MALSPGTYDFEVKTFAQPLPTTSPVLALGYGIVAGQTVTAGSAPVIGVSIGGIVGSAKVTIPFPNVHQLDSFSQVITVAVMDNANNTIVSNGFVDLNGNPVSVSIADAAGLVSFSPSTITAPGTQVTMTYTPPTSFTATAIATALNDGITTTLSSGQPPLTSAYLTGNAPIAVYTPFPGFSPTGITSGGDGRLWVNLHPTTTGPDLIGAVNTQTTLAATYGINGMGSSPTPHDIAYNPSDGNVYFAGNNQAYVGAMNTTGSMVGTPQNLSSCGGINPYGIAASGLGSGSLGIWVTDYAGRTCPPLQAVWGEQVGSGITAYSTSGTTEYIALGPDGRMWFTEPSANKIGAITTGTPTVTEYSAGISAAVQPYGICAGADGNLWFTELMANTIYHVGKITPSGAVTEIALPATATSSPFRCAAGTDGNIWFSFATGTNYIARVNPTTLVATMYPLPTTLTTPNTNSLASGVDGNMWITDSGDNALIRVIP